MSCSNAGLLKTSTNDEGVLKSGLHRGCCCPLSPIDLPTRWISSATAIRLAWLFTHRAPVAPQLLLASIPPWAPSHAAGAPFF